MSRGRGEGGISQASLRGPIPRLIIDDRRVERSPHEGTILCKTAEEALALLHAGALDTEIEALYLDHDLGEDEYGNPITSRPFVDELERICALGEREPIRIRTIYIHTSNPAGKEYIWRALTNRHTSPHYSDVRKVSDTDVGLYDPN
jgi:hypothetical protein